MKVKREEKHRSWSSGHLRWDLPNIFVLFAKTANKIRKDETEFKSSDLNGSEKVIFFVFTTLNVNNNGTYLKNYKITIIKLICKMIHVISICYWALFTYKFVIISNIHNNYKIRRKRATILVRWLITTLNNIHAFIHFFSTRAFSCLECEKPAYHINLR